MAKPSAPANTPPRSNGKHPGGRPSKYDPAYCEQLLAFGANDPYSTLKIVEGESGKIAFIRQANDPPLLVNFALKIGVHLDTLYAWGEAHPEFSEALGRFKAFQERYYVTCGTLGLSNAAITKLILMNHHGYKDRELNLDPEVVRGLVQQLVIVIVDQLPKANDREALIASLRGKLTNGAHA